jgi:DNA repair photolyase
MRLDTKRDPDGGWYDRFVRLVDDDGRVIEEFGQHPTLDQLREAERRHGERINLWQQGLVCHNCGNQITDRFSATPDGHLVCWDCATQAEGEERGDLRVNADPTKTVLSESKLHQKSLCDYVVNVATGCRHGCKFCYVPSTPAIESRDEMLQETADVEDPQRDWGNYLLYRDDLPERTREGLQETDFDDWKTTDRGRGVVMLSSGTDCYQDRRTAQITRGVVHELTDHDVPVRILTRSPNVTRDIDLFQQAGDLVTVGTSIPSFDTALVRAIEPGAPPPEARWQALDELFRAGVRRYVSFSPTYPTMDREDIREALSWFAAIDPEVVFHEPINPRGINFEMCVEAVRDVGYEYAAAEFERLQDYETWVEYSLEQIRMVRDVAEQFGNIEVHTWPDRELIEATRGETQLGLKAMRRRPSPERFPEDGP